MTVVSTSTSADSTSREHFAAPASVITSVSKSMARLKSLKTIKTEGSRAPSPAPAARPAGRVAKTKISDITSRLRSLKVGPGEGEPSVESTADPGDATGQSGDAANPQSAETVQWRSEVEIPTANDALQAAAARLKALASGASGASAPTTATGSGSTEAGSDDPAVATTKKLKLGGAASKLAALRGGSPAKKIESPENEEASVESLEPVT